MKTGGQYSVSERVLPLGVLDSVIPYEQKRGIK